jgi:hypothetical protein
MGHSGEGIRVTGRLEVVGDARGMAVKLWAAQDEGRRWSRGRSGGLWAAAPSDAADAHCGFSPVGPGPDGLGPI